jgi:predicted Zn-dependent peptidase
LSRSNESAFANNKLGSCHGTLNKIASGPELQHQLLKNGCRTVSALMPDADLTCLDFWCRGGSVWEDQGEEGLAHVLEHMVFKGSATLQAGEFDRRIEALGGSSNAATGFDDVHFHVLVPSSCAQNALDLLLDLVLNPALRDDAYGMERDVVLEEIAQYRDQPDEQVFQTLLSQGFGQHPYGRPILGWEKSLLDSTPEVMRQFHNRRYRGPNCCLAISGAVTSTLLEQIHSSQLAELEASPDQGDETASSSRSLAFQSGRQSIRFPRLEAARLLMAWPMAAANDQDSVMGADLATTLLAEGRRSRLVQRLREDLQIVESIDMDVTVMEQGSVVMLEACCPEDQIEQVEAVIEEELKRATVDAIGDEELHRAKQLVGNGLRFSLEAPGSVAAIAGSQSLWGRTQTLLSPLSHLQTWTVERLQQSLLPRLQPDQAFTLLALPEDSE